LQLFSYFFGAFYGSGFAVLLAAIPGWFLSQRPYRTLRAIAEIPTPAESPENSRPMLEPAREKAVTIDLIAIKKTRPCSEDNFVNRLQGYFRVAYPGQTYKSVGTA
jgi:hypothetical protein